MRQILTVLSLFVLLLPLSAQNSETPAPASTIVINFAFLDAATGKALLPRQFSLTDENGAVKNVALITAKLGRLIPVGLESGAYTAVVEADGYKRLEARLLIDEGAARVQKFNLDAEQPDKRLSERFIQLHHKDGFIYINGFVVNEAGLPVAKATLSGSGARTQSKNDGYFELYVPVKGTTDETTVLAAVHPDYAAYKQNNILVWSGGDWQTIVKLKKKAKRSTPRP